MKNKKYLKVYEYYLEKIQDHSLRSGDTIPSTRELSKRFQCHRFTIMNALQMLKAEGWLVSDQRKSYKVSEKIPIFASVGEAKKDAKELKINSKPLGESFELERAKFKIAFWGGQPDIALFPKDELRKTLGYAFKKAKDEDLSYGNVTGLDIFKKQVAEYLRRARNITGKEMIVTNGSQEAIYVIAKIFLQPGDRVIVERKGYPAAWRIFESLGVAIIPVDVDQEGLKTEGLESLIKKHSIKMIYLTPLHQYPTTVTLSPKRRSEVIKQAEKWGIPILEDDYDHEFHYTSPPPVPMVTQSNHVIYVNSFSKIFVPGARLGVILCAPNLLKPLAQQKYIVSHQTDSFTQITLSQWMKEGGFERHLRRMSRIYYKRYLLMIDLLEKIKSKHEVEFEKPNGGMSIWVNFFQDSQKISERCQKQGVFFQFEKSMDYLESAGTHLRIGFAGVNESQMEKGFAVLKDCLL